MITIDLPYPPSVNRYWRSVKGRVLISEQGRAYRKAVCQAIGIGGNTLNQRLAVTVDAWMPDKRKRDIDNIAKAVLDAITFAGVWNDDELIDDLRIIRRGVEAPGRVVVSIQRAD